MTHAYHSETPEQPRARIWFEHPGMSIIDYDGAYALGYEPESWDGMWRLPDDGWAVIWLTRNWALVREVRTWPGVPQRAVYTRRGRCRIRWFLRRRVR